MRLLTTASTCLLLVAVSIACGQTPAVAPESPATNPAPATVTTPAPLVPPPTEAPRSKPDEPTAVIAVAPQCSPVDWSARALPPLLKPGKTAKSSEPDRPTSPRLNLAPQCGDAPGGPVQRTPTAVVHDGVVVELIDEDDAGMSGRGWPGNQCDFLVRLADGSGAPVELTDEHTPPFTNITSLVRSGSAVWLSVTFNGYTKEFPKGGNRILALDLCKGSVIWQSKDAMSNGGLLLVGDYLIAPFGFTSERRFVYVLDARSGKVVQRLPVVENICPSKTWAPNWKPGERCDAPGQIVGAANQPRIEAGFFLVDTNTGSASFELK
ncbi:MAG TPA: hypothetical protein VJN18_21525 [Polyangiaceae bacterium]|nr:hypothetical protein [Polyangiaceae bacterium]